MNYKRQFVNLSTLIILFLLSALPTMAQKEAEAKTVLEKTTQAPNSPLADATVAKQGIVSILKAMNDINA